MRVPLVWSGLRGTLGMQVVHLAEHLERLADVLPGLTQGQKARNARPEDGVSAELLRRIVARKHGKWAEPAKTISDELKISRWRVEYFRKREREGAVCAS